MEKSQSYGGSLIDFDLPAENNSEANNYFDSFCKKLTEWGFTVRRQPGSANVVRAAKNARIYYMYFQGAGRTPWWGFSNSVIQKWKDEAAKKKGAGFCLILGRQESYKTLYWYYEVRGGENWGDRLLLAGEDPSQFTPKFARLGGDRTNGTV